MIDRTALLEDRVEQIRRDLDELAIQAADGEIDELAAGALRKTYVEELDRAEHDLLDAQEEARTRAAEQPESRSRTRLVVGGLLLVTALAVSVGLAGQFVQRRDVSSLEGVVTQPGQIDLDSVSDEAMLAAIETFEADPQYSSQIPRMRFALAERKLEKLEYDAAFDQLQAILQADPPPPADLAAPTLTRMAWIVWLNGEAELALQLADRSLELVAGAPETLYVKAQIMWCGMEDTGAAAELLARLSNVTTLDDDVRAQVDADLEALSSGEQC